MTPQILSGPILKAWLTVALALGFCGASPAAAQVPAPLPRAFVGIGAGAATDDAQYRMRLFTPAEALSWTVESGVAPWTRIGLGIEFGAPSEVTATTRGTSFRASGRQTEQTLVGLVRGRVLASERVAFDLVGGAGVLFQHHERRQSPCPFAPCPDIIDETVDRRAPAFAFGADVPIQLARRIWISGYARAHALLRGDNRSTFQRPRLVPCQYEWASSMRIALGATGRFGW